MSDDKNKSIKPSCSKKLIPQRYKASVLKETEDFGIQDQIIIAPEVMRMILEQLDLRNLKKVRLVCKSWLQEAQPHLERRGIIGILHESSDSSSSLQKFIKTREKNISALPLPFRSIDVSLGQPVSIVLNWLIQQIENPDSPVIITRFSPGGIPLALATQLANQHSSTLEYLMLSFQCTNELSDTPWFDWNITFPNLRHLHVHVEETSAVNSQASKFGYLVPVIIQASPNLENYEYTSVSSNAREEGIIGTLMTAGDIRNVKTLKLSMDSPPALLNLLFIKFRQLQNLKILFPLHEASLINNRALTTTLEKSAATMKTLNLLSWPALENVAFPLCPCVVELTLDSFPYSNNFLSLRFPSLQILNVTSVDVDVLGRLWRDLFPLPSLKTLRAKKNVLLRGWDDTYQSLIRFLSKFPNLERVRLDYSFVRHCCRIKAAGGDPQVLNLLGGVKHLELGGLGLGFRGDDEDYYSPFAALTEIETLTLVDPNASLVRIPFQYMLSLKVLRFPWGKFFNTRKVSVIAKGLGKVVITNCCSFPRAHGDSWPSNNLQSFFDSAPNAECGCKEWKETSPEWD